MRPFRFVLGALLASTSLVTSGQALAQSSSATELEEVVVTGEITYRNRTETTAPELVYDREFFEKFEPVSVGDQLKRVPGVAFTSDVGEYDAPQLRGLGAGFTQVLINGRSVPGAGNDRSVLVDRIPAEIVDRIEIVRSPSADIDSQGVGGTINIILKDGASLPPGVIVRGGVNYDVDGENFSPSGSVSWSGRSANERVFWSATLDAQKRYNVKNGVQEVFNEDSAGFDETNNVGLDLFSQSIGQSVAVERVEQIDARESTDIAFNGDLTINLTDNQKLRFDLAYIDTRRDETEDEVAYERDSSSDPFDPPELASQDTRIEQQTFNVSALYDLDINDTTSFQAQGRFSQFTDSQDQIEMDGPLASGVPQDQETIDATDKEWSGDAAFTFKFPNMMSGAQLKVGVAGKLKSRDYTTEVFEDLDPGPPVQVPTASGVFTYDETRLDGFVVGETRLTPTLKLQAGLRVEHTSTEQESGAGVSADSESTEWNPSAHLQWEATPADQFRFSVARTVRRPTYDQVIPYTQTDDPEDDDITTGNPNLKFETSWGVDVGYERRIGTRGIFGVNLFYRDVKDLISLVNSGVATPGGGNFYTFENIGDGHVSGVEFDLSTPLSFLGLDETGVFANYTRLFSKKTEPTTGVETRFDKQPSYVYNIGFTHNIPSWDTSFGASYQKQGEYIFYQFGEIETGTYGANLEVFVEKRIGDNVVLRLSGNNLLDSAATQVESNFDGDIGQEILDNQKAGIIDNYEVEREESSPTITFTIRAVF